MNKYRKIFIALLILSLIVTICFNALTYDSNDGVIHEKELIDFMEQRVRFVNYKAIDNRNNLSYNDLATEQQIKDRVLSILNLANKYNNMYPDIHYQRVALDVFAIIEHETSFINYLELDTDLEDDIAAGVTSMLLSTAEELAGELDKEFWYDKFMASTHFQIELAVYHYYKLLQRFDGNRIDARTAYNTGHNISFEQHWIDYAFIVEGMVSYYKTVLKKGGF